LVDQAVSVNDKQTQQAMRWLDKNHGLRSEPSGATAALLHQAIDLSGEGRSFGAEIRTYDTSTDHQTGQRDRSYALR